MKSSLRLPLWGVALAAALSAAALPAAQDFKLPPGKKPDAATLKAIADKTNQLGKAIHTLRRKGLQDPLLADLEVFHRAALMIVKHNEFFQAASAAQTLTVLDRGLQRAKQTEERDVSWAKATGRTVACGYRSRLDGSVQPYAVTFPEGYDKDDGKKWRLDVVLHGRDSGLTEVKFLHAHSGDKAAPAGQQFVRIDIYGRGNNAYRWAGEVDVYEATQNLLLVERLLHRDKLIDPRRWVLRGFSMGGAGTWHLGLHRPDLWCVLGPGAGFSTTRGYVAKLPQLPPWQERCLHIYDAVDYAENAFDVPVVAYGGSEDPQLKAARNIEARLKGTALADRVQVLVGQGLAHKFPPAWQKKAEAAYAPHIAKGREEYPKRVRFVTWTLKYPSCDWVRVLGLERHYEKALVDAEKTEDGFKVKTANVRNLRLGLPQGVLHDVTVQVDGQELTAKPWGMKGAQMGVYLQRKDGRWAVVLPQRLLTDRQRHPQKVTGLQGPIDDAFTDPFLCVRGTGKPWHEGTQRYADAAVQRFKAEWSKYWRGDLPVKDDVDVTSEDVADRHLILFGDPSSNSLIAHVLDALPLRWTKDKVALGGKEYSAADHVPVLIFVSPLNPSRYLVLNSGHTFPTADYERTNALLYPRLGDYAILRLPAVPSDAVVAQVAEAGLFDEYWQIPKGGR